MDATKALEQYSRDYNVKYFTEGLGSKISKVIPEIIEDDSLEIARVFLMYTKHTIRIAHEPSPGAMFYRILDLNKGQIESINFQFDLLHDLLRVNVPKHLTGPGKWYVSFNSFEQSVDLIKKLTEETYGIISCNEINSIFLGIDTMFFLEHQNVSRYKALMNDPKATKSNKMFNDFFKEHNNYPENCLIISGSTLHAYGTTYTSDIDMFIIGQDGPVMPEQVEYYSFVNDTLKYPEGISEGRVEYWTKTWPQTFGAQNLEQVLHDPRYHFSFLGAKFMSIKGTIQRLMSRAAPAAYVDLLMLKDMNKIDTGPFCVPNSSLRKGSLKIYDSMTLQKLYKTMSKFFREWHGINRSEQELSKIVKRCPSGTCCPAESSVGILDSWYTNFVAMRDAKICGTIDRVLSADPSSKALLLGTSDNVKAYYSGNRQVSFSSNSMEHYTKILIDSSICPLRDVLKESDKIGSGNITVIYPNAARVIDGVSYEIRKNDDPVFGIYLGYKYHKGPVESMLVYFQGDPQNDRGTFREIIDPESLQKDLSKKYGRKYKQMTTTEFGENDLDAFGLTELEDITIDPVRGSAENDLDIGPVIFIVVSLLIIFSIITLYTYYSISSRIAGESYNNLNERNLRFRDSIRKVPRK